MWAELAHRASGKSSKWSNWWEKSALNELKSFLCSFHIIRNPMCSSSADHVTPILMLWQTWDVLQPRIRLENQSLWSFSLTHSTQLNIQSSLLNFSDISKTCQKLLRKPSVAVGWWVRPTVQTLNRSDFFENVFKDDKVTWTIAVEHSRLSR